MAQELRTDADIRRVAKAFMNTRSKPHQWTVKDFGYCTKCNSVTEYHYGTGEMGLGPSWTCLKCKTVFYELTVYGIPMRDQFSTRYFYLPKAKDAVENPKSQKELRELHSRAQQKKFFIELLQARLDAATVDFDKARLTLRNVKNILHEIYLDLKIR